MQEHGRGRDPGTFVAIYKRVVIDQGFRQRGSLVVDVGIQFFSNEKPGEARTLL
jgi:hypothetical protein